MRGAGLTAGEPGGQFRGRRHGRRLRPGRQQLVDDLLPRLAIAPDAAPLDPGRLFDRRVEALWLEVGFGAGEHLAWQAAHNPDIGLIGCEPFMNGVAALLSKVAEAGEDMAARVRLWPDQAAPLIQRLPARSVARVFLLFPDPWPKRRHWNRRFIQTATLDALSRVMTVGGELRLATDDPRLADWMLMRTRAHPAFHWTAGQAADWHSRPDDWPATRYEIKEIRGKPAFFRFRHMPVGDSTPTADGVRA